MTDLESVVESNLSRYSRALGQMFFASLTVYVAVQYIPIEDQTYKKTLYFLVGVPATALFGYRVMQSRK